SSTIALALLPLAILSHPEPATTVFYALSLHDALPISFSKSSTGASGRTSKYGPTTAARGWFRYSRSTGAASLRPTSRTLTSSIQPPWRRVANPSLRRLRAQSTSPYGETRNRPSSLSRTLSGVVRKKPDVRPRVVSRCSSGGHTPYLTKPLTNALAVRRNFVISNRFIGSFPISATPSVGCFPLWCVSPLLRTPDLQRNAEIPVTDWPMLSAWISSVPS